MKNRVGLVAVQLLQAVILVLAFAWAPARAQDAAAPPGFASPSLPLADALKRFGQQAGFDVVVTDAMIGDKRSSAISRTDNPHAALAQLLRGTGLVPRFTRPNAFILEPVPDLQPPDMRLDPLDIQAVEFVPRAGRYHWYGQELLTACLRTLAESQPLGARSYDLVVYFWIDPAGRVTQLKVESDPAQDDVMRLATEVLRGLVPTSLPPADMPQPVGLRIAAR